MKGDHGFSVSHKAHSCLHIRPIRPPSIGGSHCTRSRCLSIPDVRGSAVHDQRFTPTSPLSLHLRPGAYFRGRESLDESQDLKPVATVTPAPWKTGQRGCFTLHAAYQRTEDRRGGRPEDRRTRGQEQFQLDCDVFLSNQLVSFPEERPELQTCGVPPDAVRGI